MRIRPSLYLTGLMEKATWDVSFGVETVNGLPGVVTRANGVVFGVMSIDVRDGRIQNVYLQLNPAKLPAPPVPSDAGLR